MTILEDIPSELLAEFLNYLDLQSMLRCRCVCSNFRDLIDSSAYFRWKTELLIAGKESCGNYPLVVRRKMLEQHQDGWSYLRWTKEMRLAAMNGGFWELQGNVLAQNTPDMSAIHFNRLPSQSRNIEEKEWIVDIQGMRMADFSIDPGQDLLVIVQLPIWYQGDRSCQVFLRTLSTGEPHPLTTGHHFLTHLLTHARDLQGQWPIQVCGDILGVSFDTIDSDEVEIILWNWKSGQPLMNITSEEIMDMAFLSEKHIMFAVLQRPILPSLVVVDFIAEPPEQRTLNEVEHAFTFRFPPISDCTRAFRISVRSDPAPNWTPSPNSLVPFFTSRHDRLYFITLRVSTTNLGTREVEIYALGRTFLSLIEEGVSGRSSASFDWAAWGPEGTRMIISRHSHSPTWTRYVYGTRHVSTRQPQGDQADYVYVFDFNQPALKWSLDHEYDVIGDIISKFTTTMVLDEGTAETLLPYLNISEPTKVRGGDIFQLDVETRLGYRMKRWAIPGRPRVRSAMCSEDGIVIVCGSDVAEEYHILTI